MTGKHGIWFNLIVATLAAISSLSGNLIPPEIVTLLLALGNIIIHYLTLKEV